MNFVLLNIVMGIGLMYLGGYAVGCGVVYTLLESSEAEILAWVRELKSKKE